MDPSKTYLENLVDFLKPKLALNPVAADFIGLSLQTTLQEHVAVNMKAGKISVSLL